MLLAAFCIILTAGVQADRLKGLYTSPEGGEFVYYILETPQLSQLLLGETGFTELKVNVTYDKVEGAVEGTILGHSFTNDGDDLEIEPEITLALLTSSVGRALPEIGFKVHRDHGVFGHESHAAMALYKLGMASDAHHADRESLPRALQRRSIFTSTKSEEEKYAAVKGFPLDVQTACMGINKGCSNDIEYQDEEGYTTPACPEGARKFSVKDIENECWGMCGPQCICWNHVCGDCCAHPGCLRHDAYCQRSGKSKDCLTLRGVLWDKGPSAC